VDGNQAVAALAAAYPAAILSSGEQHGQTVVEVASGEILSVCRFLRDEQQYTRLSGITAVDWYPGEPRFEVVYLLHSLERNERLRLKCRVPSEAAGIESVTGAWPNANWYEREVFDLFGVVFRNHPDLRRILMPEDWEGHPLRKDYQTTGKKYTYQQE
jgi:NADH-quinone oxidoreductase subunit C